MRQRLPSSSRLLALAGWVAVCLPAAVAGGADSTKAKVTMQVLSNGAGLIVEPMKDNEVVAAFCLLRQGAYTELDAENGLTHLTLRMLTRGTTSMDAETLSETVESMGASLSAGATDDYSYVSFVCVRDDFWRMMDILEDVLFHPAFDYAELEKERDLVVAGLRRGRDDKFEFAYDEFLKDLYRGHPYSRDPQGTPENLQDFLPIHLTERHREVCRTSEILLSVCGDVNAERLASRLEDWPAPTDPPKRRFRVTKTFGHRLRERVVQREFEQAFMIMGYVTCPMNDPDHAPLRVLSAALGEGMSSPLFKVLRDRAGLAYAVGSFYTSRLDKGHLACYVGVSADNIDRARTGISVQVDRLRDELLDPREFSRAQRYVIGKFLLATQTNASRARLRALAERRGVGFRYIEEFPEQVRRVTRDRARKVAREYFDTLTTLIVAPAR